MEQLRRLTGAACRLWVGGKHNGAAGLQCDQGLVAHGGGGIGAGHNGTNGTHGHPELPQPLLRDLPQKAHGLHRPDGLQDGLAGKQILFGLVLGVAEAGLFHSQLGKGGTLRLKGRRHGGNDAIQFFLRVGFQGLLGLPCPSRQVPGLLPGLKIRIQFHNPTPFLLTFPWGAAVDGGGTQSALPHTRHASGVPPSSRRGG